MVVKRKKAQAERGLTANEVQLISNLATTRANFFREWLDPRRDIDEECGYPENISLDHYVKLYKRGDIASRVNDLWPAECWSSVPEIFEKQESDRTVFEEALRLLIEKHNLFHHFEQVDKQQGIGHFGVMVLGFDDKRKLSDPVAGLDEKTGESAATKKDATKAPPKPSPKKKPTTNAPPVIEDEDTEEDDEDTSGSKVQDTIIVPEPERNLLWIRTYDESMVSVMEREEDEFSPRYGMPKFYKVSMFNPKVANTPDTTASTVVRTSTDPNKLAKYERKVHWHRVIHVAEQDDSHAPRMEVVWNRLLDLVKIMGGSAEMFWKGGFMGLSIETAPGYEGSIDIDSAKEQIDAFSNKLQRYMALAGLTAKSLAPQVADPSNHVNCAILAICITMGVPKRIFEGSERGEQNSSQDAKAWARRVLKRCRLVCWMKIMKPFIERLIAVGVLPPLANEDSELECDWPDSGAPSPMEEAETCLKWVEAMSKYMLGDCAQLIPPKDFLTRYCGFENDEADAILEAAEEIIAEEEAEAEKMQKEYLSGVPGAQPAPPEGTLPPPPPVAPGAGGFPGAKPNIKK